MAILQSKLRAHVERLARTPRVPGTQEHADACAYIENQLRLSGYEPRRASAGDGRAINVHAGLGDPTKRVLVVGAHYDSVVGSPGADDNASGVAALLEVGRAYAGMKPSMGLELVAYDLEESGLVGSREHCNKLRREGAEVVGMLSLEMLGFTGEDQVLVAGVETERARGDFLAIVANESSAHLLKMFDGIDLALPMERVVAPMGTEAGALSYLSDHGSFWDAGLPALLVTDTALLRNPHYHRSTDLPATLDYDFLTASTEAVLSAVRRFTA